MAADELFKRYLEVGASVLGMSRDRAEGIVRDLVASGEVAKGQATKAADWLVERGRVATDELVEIVRREVRQQVAAMGLATKDDIARLEDQLREVTQGAPAPPPSRSRARASTGTGTAETTGRTNRSRAASTGTAATESESGAAGITRAGSVRRRPGAAGAPEPGSRPPAGGALPPKG